LRKNIGKKVAPKMLMKLTPWVNFTNIGARLFCKQQDEKLFVAFVVWQAAHRFGKFQLTNLA